MENNDLIKEVRSANDIVEVISSYIPLIKKGKNYFGVCPFHDDTNPSMSVSPDKQIYKCFSCGASGNVFNFVMDYESVDFKTALNILAKRANINIGNTTVKSNNKFDKYYKIYDLAEKFYQNNLNSKVGKEAKEYLHKRDISDELIEQFKIGLSTTEKNGLVKLLSNKGHNIKDLDMLGLSNNEDDLYINRIMFPLFNPNGEVIGFSGRIYNTTSQSKYINTRETPIFKKGENLYNYHLVKDAVRKEKKVIIVEGFMDVIRLYAVGIKNVIALMGTSITKEQVTLIKRLSNNIIISLDGDGPGKKAAFVVGNELEKENLNIGIVSLKENLDPDEFVIKYGKDEYQSLIDNPIEFSDYKISYLKEGKNLTSLEEKTDYINKVLEEVNKEKDIIKQELLLNKLSDEFGITVEILRKKLQNDKKYSKIEPFEKDKEKKQKLDKYKLATYRILYFMLFEKEAIKTFEKKLNYLPYSEARYLANEIICYSKKEPEFIVADFITTLNDKEDLKELTNLVLQVVDEEFDLDCFNEYILVIKDYSSSQEIERLKELIKKEPDPEKKALLAEKIRLVKIGS